GQDGVVTPTVTHPLLSPFFQADFWRPHLLSHWQLRHFSFWRLAVHWVTNELVAIVEVGQGNVVTLTFGPREDEPGWVVLAPNAQWVNFHPWLVGSQGWVDFQHV